MADGRSRLAIVTGTSSGIGRAIASRLVGERWTVIGLDRSAAPDPGGISQEQIVDLAHAESVVALASQLPPPDALIHAAGLMRTGRLEALDYREGDQMYAVHVRALALLMKELVPRMNTGGRVVAIGSRTSAGAASKSQYAATKAALTGLVRSLAAEVVPNGITVNIVSPAATVTPLLADPDRAAVKPSLPPIGRFIEPAEVAATVSFLLSEGAAAITGQNIVICGGASL